MTWIQSSPSFVPRTGTKHTKWRRGCPAAHVREAAVLLHGHDPVCHQQPQQQEDDAERDLHVDRGPLPVLQRGGQTWMEGTFLKLDNKRLICGNDAAADGITFFFYICRIPSAITSLCTTCSSVRRHQMVRFLSGRSDLRPIAASLWIRCTRWAQLTSTFL